MKREKAKVKMVEKVKAKEKVKAREKATVGTHHDLNLQVGLPPSAELQMEKSKNLLAPSSRRMGGARVSPINHAPFGILTNVRTISAPQEEHVG